MNGGRLFYMEHVTQKQKPGYSMAGYYYKRPLMPLSG